MLLTTPAIPTVSSGRPQFLPLIETPPDTVRSMSVKSHGSTLGSAQPARAKTPTVSEICCSRFMLTPGRLAYLLTAMMSAGSPVIWASVMASWYLPARPRLRKPVTLSLPGWPHNSALLDFRDQRVLLKGRVEDAAV